MPGTVKAQCFRRTASFNPRRTCMMGNPIPKATPPPCHCTLFRNFITYGLVILYCFSDRQGRIHYLFLRNDTTEIQKRWVSCAKTDSKQGSTDEALLQFHTIITLWEKVTKTKTKIGGYLGQWLIVVTKPSRSHSSWHGLMAISGVAWQEKEGLCYSTRG